MTVRDLAKSARFSARRVEEIEAGLETWFSSTDRQLLAKALSVEPEILQEVESRRHGDENIPQMVMDELADLILHGQRDLQCPRCGGNLRCSVQQGFDIEGKPMHLPKAFCQKCPFVLK
jgi:hypothetical protein